MTLEEARTAYEVAFGDYSKLSLYLSMIQGTIAVSALVLFIVSFAILLVFAKKKSMKMTENESKWIFVGNVLVSIQLLVFFIFAFPLLDKTKDEIIVMHPAYKGYVENYVNPYLFSLPEKRYDNLKIENIPRSGLFLTNVNEDNESFEKEKQFRVDSLSYVLLEDGKSSYISERVLDVDLSDEYKAGYKLQVAYISETDKGILEDYLGYEIEIPKLVKSSEENSDT